MQKATLMMTSSVDFSLWAERRLRDNQNESRATLRVTINASRPTRNPDARKNGPQNAEKLIAFELGTEH